MIEPLSPKAISKSEEHWDIDGLAQATEQNCLRQAVSR